jgi:hypothetical protein
MKKKAIILIVLALLLATVGVVYAHWTDTLEVDAVVETGDIDMAWVGASGSPEFPNGFFPEAIPGTYVPGPFPGTDDDGIVGNDYSGDDIGDVSALYDAHGTASSDDPARMFRSPHVGNPTGYPGGMARHDKDVGICTVAVDGKTMTVTLGNTYPSYHCSVFAAATNLGSVPVKAAGLTFSILKNGTEAPSAMVYEPDPYSGGVPNILHVYFGGELELTLDTSDGIACGSQIDPDGLNDVIFWYHLEQGADQDATYTITSTQEFMNWNEWDETYCTINGQLP